MKRKTTREILAESFRELAESRSIDKITVKDIADNCGYSSATFYRQFKDKYDLIAWEYAQRASEIMERIGRDDYTWKRTLLDGAVYFQKEREYLSNLLLHTGGQESFLRYMTEINCEELTKYVRKAVGRKELGTETELYIRVYCMGTVCLSCEWILGSVDITPEELAEIYENSLPAPLHSILLKR